MGMTTTAIISEAVKDFLGNDRSGNIINIYLIIILHVRIDNASMKISFNDINFILGSFLVFIERGALGARKIKAHLPFAFQLSAIFWTAPCRTYSFSLTYGSLSTFLSLYI